jgi:type III restriction enzyme
LLTLKDYQSQCLDRLREYFFQAGEHGARPAFVLMTNRPYLGVPHLPELPYVCIRVPTGGGKTFMACHALDITARELLHQDRTVCLWLVPTKQIARQTLDSLRDRKHPYRQALDAAFGGHVAVMDLGEALYVPRGTLAGDTAIIVSTLAALRVEDTEGRKVYEAAGALEPHVSGLPEEVHRKLECYESGKPVPSLANVLRMWEPVVIMDEAHNARTKLSFETLERFSPSCIIEFTATPQLHHDPEKGNYASNVIAHVSAAQLKAEEMIKLPIMLHTRPDWKEVLADTVGAQRDLEKAAADEEAATGEYIRPIALIQAQPHREGQDTVTVDVVRASLLGDCKVPEEQIAIATGAKREIEGVDLFDRKCPVRFIITQQALKEGWDCSFAYIFASVADIGSTKDVEQLLGRVLRLPRAKSKRDAKLNHAYAMVSSQRFVDTLGRLAEALIENGFERIEAEQFITPSQPLLPGVPGPLFSGPGVSESVPEAPDLSKLHGELRERVTYDADAGTVSVVGAMTAPERAALEKCFETDAGKAVAEKLYDASRGRAVGEPSAEPMRVPGLSIKVDGQLELFDESHFTGGDWDLSKWDATLAEGEFSSVVVAGADGELDISEAGKIEARAVQQVRKQLALLRPSGSGWTVEGLTNWIDRDIWLRFSWRQAITRTQATLFIQRAIEELVQARGVTADQLASEKFRLAGAVAGLMRRQLEDTRRSGWQAALFGAGANEIMTDPAMFLVIGQDKYDPNWYYEGGFQFGKPALRVVGELKSDGEEFECARYIDQMEVVKRWVRNLDHGESAFWLQTSSDRFYPDFVAELTDGRWLVVESKGEHLWSNDDSKEKRTLGNLWADRSNGRCIFVMPKGPNWAAIDEALA